VSRRAYLGIGSNLGDRLAHLQFAVDGLGTRAGPLAAISPVYETRPVGGPEQPDYLNAVVAVDTDLSARRLLEIGKELETGAGRDLSGERWGPRPLDIDILRVGDEHIDEPDLVVPHPRLHQRAFVLAPLADLAPDLIVAPSAGWQGIRRTSLQLSMPE
jgi:2-amino-4-hydroxy-6-hydroxymethyldihydropteridine diphosphokinase